MYPESVSLYLLSILLITPSKGKNLSTNLPFFVFQLKSTTSDLEPKSIISLVLSESLEKGSSSEKWGRCS